MGHYYKQFTVVDNIWHRISYSGHCIQVPIKCFFCYSFKLQLYIFIVLVNSLLSRKMTHSQDFSTIAVSTFVKISTLDVAAL
jgi:hypothetical protein